MDEIRDFLGSIHPFDTLTPTQLEKIVENTDIGYYLEGENIEPEKFFVVLKGSVGEIKEGEMVDIYFEKDGFDAKALIKGSDSSFTAQEETLLYEIDKEAFLSVFDQNREFKNYFLQGIAHKIEKYKEQKSLTSFSDILSAKIKDLKLNRITFVTSDTPIKKAVEKLERVLGVKREKDIGIVTATDLKKVIENELDFHTPVDAITNYDIVKVDKESFLFNALLLMTKKGIEHLLVEEDGKIAGSLELSDVLSFFSNQSYLLAKKIEGASDIEELKDVKKQLENIVKNLFSKGSKSRYTAKLISELNQKLYKKVYELTFGAPGTLLLLGSEGRGEQLLKTDQDNAFIVSKEEDLEDARARATRFTEALLEIGFPKCPGGVMVSNPLWCQTYEGFKNSVTSWILNPTQENLLNLSIFFDASALGDEEPLKKLKKIIFELTAQNSGFFSHIAKPAVSFERPFGFLNRLKEKIDIKKGGIFPVVHGARVLAMEHRIFETNSVERLKTVSDMGILDKKFTTDLIESYDILQNFRLKNYFQHNGFGNMVDIKELNKLERDLLKESLKIVDEFKGFLRYHYRLDMVE